MKPITVFEHNKITIGKDLTHEQHIELEKFHSKNDKFFSLVHNGVKFNQYVGVLQVGNLTIEILPKLDNNDENKNNWRNRLISMLKYVGYLKVHAPSQSSLSVHHSSILELYIELFCRDVETLMHKGLIKKYRIEESNQKALKGALVFSKHISKNLVHKELFFVRSSTYDVNHPIHQILYAALLVLKRLQISPSLHTLIAKITMFFPEQKNITVTQKTFDTLHFNRKTESYRNALMIARLILLQFHPDVKEGKNDILALLFDMNRLWEAYVTMYLKRNLEGYEVSNQKRDNFCSFENQNHFIKPDIIVKKGDRVIVLDAKWKNVTSASDLSSADMYQLYAYGMYHNSHKVALVYPGKAHEPTTGNFKFNNNEKEISLSLILDGMPEENVDGVSKDNIKEKMNVLKEWITNDLSPKPYLKIGEGVFEVG